MGRVAPTRSSNTSAASKTSSTNTNPTSSTPTAASLRRVRLLHRRRGIQRQRRQSRQSRIRLLQQAGRQLRHRHLCPRPRTRRPRRHLRISVADRHLHRRLALQTGRRLQDSKKGHRPPRRHRQQKRQPPPQLPPPQQRRARLGRSQDPRRHHPLDGRQLRRHLRHPPMDDLRRRPINQSRHPQKRQGVRPQRRQKARPHRRRHPLHHQSSTIYAFIQGWPEGNAVIPSLAPAA